MSTGPNTGNTALLVMHTQPPLTEMVQDGAWLDNIAEAIQAARDAGVPVIYVKSGFREGYPELDPSSAHRRQLDAAGILIVGKTNDVHPKLTPLPGDIEIITSRVGAFTGTDLEIILRTIGVKHVVLTGISTGGVVLATFVAALDRDLSVTVLSDAVTDANPQTHRALLAHFAEGAPWFGEVISTSDWITQLPSATQSLGRS